MFKKIICLLLVLLLVGCNTTTTNNTHIKSKLYDQAVEVETYTSFDYEYAKDYFDNRYVDSHPGCSAAVKTLDDGTTITGRNFDITVSDAPVYLFKTEVEGLYDCIGIAFDINPNSKDYKEINENGIPEDTYKLIPFISSDYLNEEGLYVEINMRSFEVWPNGTAKYPLSGTNPEAETSIHIVELTNYIATHCKDVEEAKKYVESINVYCKEGGWGYAFLIADKTGNHTILEFVDNKSVWNDDDKHANFYLNKEAQANEKYKSGVGRYNYINEHLDSVKSKKDMFNIMDNLRYSTVFDPDNKVFDVRSEACGFKSYITYDYVMDPNNQKEIYSLWNEVGDIYKNSTHEEMVESRMFWNTMYTVIGDCNNKTLFIRMFEKNNITALYSFDSIETNVQLED